jgi:hypothetical protein
MILIFFTDQSEQDLMRAQLEQQPTGIRMRKTVLQHDDAKEALTLDSTTGGWLSLFNNHAHKYYNLVTLECRSATNMLRSVTRL